MSDPAHIPYRSLEQFRTALTAKYLEIYNKYDVLVQEKIHGSNISIVGTFDPSSDDNWNIMFGSRRRWILANEKFNNIQALFSENRANFISLFNTLFEKYYVDGAPKIVRIYGEIYGGKYGGSTDKNAIKTQREPDYCPRNDFAFFDAFVGDVCVPAIDFIKIVPENGLKIPPVIYKGPLADFLATFDVNDFRSRVSTEFYGLDFIEHPKATEGVVIRTVNPNPEGDEATVLKYKQTWAVENPRINKKNRTEKTTSSKCALIDDCIAMLNENRITSYKSKNTIDELTDQRRIGEHVGNIVSDTMKDVVEEFPPNKFPDLNQREVSRALTKKAFPLFKSYIQQLGREALAPCDRIRFITNENARLRAEINSLNVRVGKLNTRLIELNI